MHPKCPTNKRTVRAAQHNGQVIWQYDRRSVRKASCGLTMNDKHYIRHNPTIHIVRLFINHPLH